MPGWLDLRCVEGAGCPKDDGMPLSSHTILSSLNLGKWFLLSTGISLFKVTLFLISWIWHRYHITHKVLVSHLVSQALQTSIPTRPKAPRPNRFGRKHNSGELGTCWSWIQVAKRVVVMVGKMKLMMIHFRLSTFLFLRLMFGFNCICRSQDEHILSHRGDTDEVNSGTWQAWGVWWAFHSVSQLILAPKV